jgi:hypothetical protein
MKGSLQSSKMIIGIASLVLSTSIFAQTTAGSVLDPVTGFLVGTTNVVNGTLLPTMKHGPEYLISNKYNSDVKVMDGLKTGQNVCSKGNMKIDHNMYKGDTITDLTTQRSGTITGIKHHGTMDVMGDNGKITRYQYVTFKVKH